MQKRYYQTMDPKPYMMGPNVLEIARELTAGLDLRPGMRVLDLGCGQGLSSLYLAEEYGALVFAADLWTPAGENFARFTEWGVGDQVVPLHVDAADPPFAEGYFDAVVSVDAYHYFGRAPGFFEGRILPLVKPDGVIALGIPGLREDTRASRTQLLRYWGPEGVDTIRTAAWWEALLAPAAQMAELKLWELSCFDQAWADWLDCTENPYAAGDRRAFAAGAGKIMNLIGITARRKS